MQAESNVQPYGAWSPDHAAQYGWTALTPLHPYANRVIGGTSACLAMIALFTTGGVIWAGSAVWLVFVFYAVAADLLSEAARMMRSPRCCYRLRDSDYRCLYVGRTRDWDERFEAHTDTTDDHDNPWRYRIDVRCSAPFKWCMTPWGEWLSERFRIRQAATLAMLRVAPPVHNHQLNRTYKSPMIAVATLVWIAEELMLGRLREREEDPLDDGFHVPYSPVDEPIPVDESSEPDPEPDEEEDDEDADPFDEIVSQLRAEGFHPAGSPIPPEAVPPSQRPSPEDDAYRRLPQNRDNGRPAPGQDPTEGTPIPPQPDPTPPTGSAPTDASQPTTEAEQDNNEGRGNGKAEGTRRPPSGAAGGRRCKECHQPATKVGPRCDGCHRAYETERKRRLRSRVDDILDEGDQ